MTTLRSIILTCLVGGQSLLAIAQHNYYILFDKDGKINNIEKHSQKRSVLGVFGPVKRVVASGNKAYPCILSDDELHFEKANVNVPKSSFWQSLDDTWRILVSGPLPNPRTNAAIDIQNSVRGAILTPLPALLGTSPKQALKYNSSNLTLPVSPASSSDVYTIETTEYDNDLNVVTRPGGLISLKDRDRIEYTLIRNKLDNDIIQKHLAATDTMYKGWPIAYDELLLELRQKFRNQGWYIDSVLVRDSLQHSSGPMHPFDVDMLDKLDLLTRPMELTDKFYRKVLADNKRWIESWLWYTGGKVQLNPFPYADPAKLIIRADREIKELESELAAMANREVSLNESDKKDRLAFLLARLQTLKQTRDDLSKANDDYTKWLAKLSTQSEIVYSGVWHGSATKEIRWLHQFDAARDYRFMNSPKLLPNMVASQDQVVIYTHNLGTDDKVTITSVPTPFQPKSGLETTADAIAVELAKAVGGSSSIQGLAQLVAGLNSSTVNKNTSAASRYELRQAVRSIRDLSSRTQNVLSSQVEAIDLKNFIKDKIGHINFKHSQLISNDPIIQDINNRLDAVLSRANANLTNPLLSRNQQKLSTARNDSLLAETVREIIKSLQTTTKANALAVMFGLFDIKDQIAYDELIQNYADRKNNLIWLSAQTVPILSLTLKPDEKPVYHTQAEFPEKKVAVESSNKVAYTLMLNDKTTVARQTYSKYYTSRFMPSFGLVYVFEDRTSLIFDEATGQFKPREKDFDHIEALVGVKWYPAKTNPARTPGTRSLIRKPFNSWANLSRGSSFLNTFYITGGLGMRRQLLRNYYLGAGVDLIPGLSIQGGGNFIFQKQYELENAKIKSETEVVKSCWYLGVGLDLGLVTNLIKVLIP